MNKSTRDRFILPILLPVGLFLAMLALMFSFSRILLNVSSEAATIVALVIASVVLAAAGVIATRKGLAASASLGSLLGIVAGVAMLAGGIALAVAPPGEEAAKGGGGAVAAFEATITAPEGAAAKGFDVDTLAFPSDTPVALTFDNQDPGVQHNVAIFKGDPEKDPAAPKLFEGTFVTGPDQTTYKIGPLPAGTYTFHCVLHPATMKGTLEVSPGGGGEGGGGASASIIAKGIEFNTKQLTFDAETPTTLSFDNQDAGTPHNLAIYSDKSLSRSLFKGDLVTGPATVDYQVPPLPAGTYYFQCDVHPTMSGTVVVKGGGGGAAGEPGNGTGEPSAGGAEAAGATGTAAGAAGEGVSVVAKGLAFDTKEIALAAGAESSLTFDNQDAGIPHNLSIYDDPSLPVDPSRPKLFTFTPFPGIKKQEFTIPAIPPGTYTFQCDVHPFMTGIVKVT